MCNAQVESEPIEWDEDMVLAFVDDDASVFYYRCADQRTMVVKPQDPLNEIEPAHIKGSRKL